MQKAATYEAIIAQLVRDGHTTEAEQVRVAAMIGTGASVDDVAASGSSIDLESLVSDALEDHRFLKAQQTSALDGAKKRKTELTGENMVSLEGPRRSIYPSFQTSYIATHKDAVLCSSFNADGTLCATGSQDTSIKLIDISMYRGDGQDKPSIRSYYENNHPVTSVQFHPRCPVLLSANNAGLMLLFNYQDHNRRSFSQYQDTHPINGLAFHPMGDWVAVAASHPLLRLYDVHSERIFVSEDFQSASHNGAITCVEWKGNTLVTGSDDGAIRFFDLRQSQSKPTNTIVGAHRSYPLITVDVSGPQTGHNYVVSAAGDGEPSLWDVRATGKRVRGFSPPSTVRCNIACFAGAQDQWVACGGQDRYVYIFDSARDKSSNPVLKGHSNSVLSISSGPQSLLTCSKDSRARIWGLEVREREADLAQNCYQNE